jgi:tripartite-type tricarboxylate transporter receptor subunit TctC
MKRTFIGSLVIGLLCAAGLAAQAQDKFPTRPLRIVVPFTAGGATDVIARLVAHKMSESLKQPVMVENRAGAGGSLSSREVARSEPDGYTMLLGTSSTHGINPWVYTKLGYDVEKDFAPITILATTEYALAVNEASSVKSMSDLLRAAKAQAQTPMAYGSAGVGTTSHLAASLLSTLSSIPFNHVPYKGGDPARNDLLGGQLPFIFDNVSTLLPYAASGKLRILATTGPTRAAVTKDYPAMAETVPSYEIIGWFALLAPAGTPQPIVETLNREAVKALKLPDVQERLRAIGNEPAPMTPAQTKAFISAQLKQFKGMVEMAGARVD